MYYDNGCLKGYPPSFCVEQSLIFLLTFQFTHYTLTSELCKLQVANCILLIAYCKLQIALCKLQIANCTLLIAYCKLQIVLCILQLSNCTLLWGRWETWTCPSKGFFCPCWGRKGRWKIQNLIIKLEIRSGRKYDIYWENNILNISRWQSFHKRANGKFRLTKSYETRAMPW